MLKPRWASRPQLAALAAILVSALPAAAQLSGKWETIAPFPEPHEEMFGATANGKMYVFGGFIPFWKVAGVVYEYDPTTN